MKLVTAIFNFFKKGHDASPRNDQRWVDGYESFQRGEKLYVDGKQREALDCFDQSIELHFEEGGIFGLRGSCLQCLDFHFDAIDDFTKAIEAEPNDCNLYYMRSVSRSAAGDLQGRVSDLQEAIRLAAAHSAVNKVYDQHASEQGWTCVADLFRAQLIVANLDLETQAEEERWLRERPNVFPGPDLATRRRAKCRRRTQP